jgi:hypothetical protein
MDEILVQRVKMVEVRRGGVLRRIFDYGDVWFDVGGGRTLRFVRKPTEWAKNIERMMNLG